MNLESFGIANFKAFGNALQRMPLRPITLIFGANSAGKSSLLHGLLWALESVSKGSFETRTSERVSGKLDLGGFRSVTHAHRIENKIAIEFGCGRLAATGEEIRIRYQVGIRSDEDFRADYQRLLKSHPEIEEFIECCRKEEDVAQTFLRLTHQRPASDTEIDQALESEETWRKFLEPYHAGLDERAEEEPGHDWDQWRENRSVDEMRELFRKGCAARKRMLELGGPELIPRARELWKSFEKQQAKEKERISVISCEVRFGSRIGLKARRPIDSDTIEIDPDSLTEDWKQVPGNDGYVIQGMAAEASRSLPAKIHTPFKGISCEILPGGSNPDDDYYGVNAHVCGWLGEHWKEIAKMAERLIYVGPLRALPLRHELIGHPGEIPPDPLLKPWCRMRDDGNIRAAINEALNGLTQSGVSFRKAIYGRTGSFRKVLEDLPVRPGQPDWLGTIPVPFRWEESGLLKGYVKRPAEFEPETEEPYYGDLKDDDPDAADTMLEKHLVENFPHEVLLDLKVRDGSTGVDVTLQDVGVGISQIAPVLVHTLGNENALVMIEQPEIHIHPALQAELGDVFIEAAIGPKKNTILLETHSEHLILRILRRIRETTRGTLPEGILPVKPQDIAVLYVESGEEGSIVQELRVNDQGRFINDWPHGFFEERFNEEF